MKPPPLSYSVPGSPGTPLTAQALRRKGLSPSAQHCLQPRATNRGTLACPPPALDSSSCSVPWAPCPHLRPQGDRPSALAAPLACLPYLVLRRGASGAHGAEGGGPRYPHASRRPRAPERRVGQHSGSRRRRRRTKGRGNGAAAGAQRRQREPARATARHHSVPSRGAAIRPPVSVLSPLRELRSAIRDFPILLPGSGIFYSKFASSSQPGFRIRSPSDSAPGQGYSRSGMCCEPAGLSRPPKV